MKEYLLERFEVVQSQLKQAYVDRAECAADAEGSHELLLRKLKKELHKLEAEIKELDEASTPHELEIYCFVLSSTTDSIKSDINEELFALIELDRYHKSDLSMWKPFRPGDSIDSLLTEFKEKKGYAFKAVYLSDELTGESIALIDKVKKNSLAIVDLLSINIRNSLITQRFDTKDIGGVIMPYCRNLHVNLKSSMDYTRQKYFKAIEYYVDSADCWFYMYDISIKQNFFRQLGQIFSESFKVKNQIHMDCSVRGIEMSIK